MNINFKLRLENKVTLTAIVTLTVAIIYQLLGIFNVTPAISQNEIIEVAGLIISLLVMLGVVTDPTTQGIGDSELALNKESITEVIEYDEEATEETEE